jgi:hypothetical protein
VLRFPSSPSINAEYGSVIHETIEWIHLSSKQNARVPNKTQIFLTFERKLLNKRLGEPHNSLLLERGKSALSSYVEQRSGTFELQGYNEFNFRNEAVFIGPAHLTGKIDKLIVDNKRHEITIVDFKTGKCYLKWAHTTRLHLYQNQLYLYKLLVENSSIFKGYKVVDAYLEFVEPDQSGKIEELHISFNDQTSGHLKLLAGSVWKHAQSLDFPDTSKFKKDVSGIVAFEDYLIAN